MPTMSSGESDEKTPVGDIENDILKKLNLVVKR